MLRTQLRARDFREEPRLSSRRKVVVVEERIDIINIIDLYKKIFLKIKCYYKWINKTY